ncbi:Uncharacterised protein [Vibrio cholerae]|uniref:Uncharacterized protein n=1 Tax=Vibrio cholerae TaxID=666 RepID=A0A655QJG0_VIBCL|nr:Uncharacterised protein [Vibrio cholerae]CSC94294.1 Uncharacterised protein [Vibrio cholerae]CSI30808.1 Uncharacterised protein [Vibrio cholerae]CSI74690.1 Uncharacterised protein [Vibrio cholerae]
MWHGRRTNFTRDGSLFEVAQGNVTPNITIKIDQDGVKTCHRFKQLSNVIMRLDLRGVRVPIYAQRFSDELFAEFMPIYRWVSRKVRVVVTHRTVDFG